VTFLSQKSHPPQLVNSKTATEPSAPVIKPDGELSGAIVRKIEKSRMGFGTM